MPALVAPEQILCSLDLTFDLPQALRAVTFGLKVRASGSNTCAAILSSLNDSECMAGLGTAPFPASSGRARAVTPPPAGDSYAALPSPSPTRTGRASHAAPTSGATASARHSLGSSRRGAGARRVSTLPRSDDDDDDDDVEQARLQGSPLSRGRPSIAASRAATSPGDGMTDYSPVARSRGRPSIAPSRAPTSPGDIGANETVEFDQSRDDSGGAGEDMDVHFDGGAGDEDQPGMDWGGGQPSSEGNERFDDNYDQPNEEDEQPPLEEVVDEEEEEEEIVVPSRAKGKGKRPRVVDPDDDDEERHEEPISAAEDEQIADDMLPAEEDDEEEEIRPAKGKGRKGKPAPTREKLPTAAEKGKSRAFTSRTAVQPRAYCCRPASRLKRLVLIAPSFVRHRSAARLGSDVGGRGRWLASL